MSFIAIPFGFVNIHPVVLINIFFTLRLYPFKSLWTNSRMKAMAFGRDKHVPVSR